MTTIGEILDRYTATWTENDPARRRELIAGLYAGRVSGDYQFITQAPPA